MQAKPGWLRIFGQKEFRWSLFAGLCLLAAWVLENKVSNSRGIAIAIYLVSYIFGSLDLVGHLIKSIRHKHFHFDIDLLMLLAAIGSACLGAWAEGAFLLFLFSLAHALEHFALDRAKGAILALADLAPSIARVMRDGRELEIPVEQLVVGDEVLVRPGERIPVDGTVRVGWSSVNQAPITGESIPVEKQPGSEIFAGTVNGEGALVIDAVRVAGDRTLDRVIRLVTESRKRKAPTQRFTERFERVFVPVVLVADVLLGVVPSLLGVWSWSTGVYRAMGLLVAASPCALALGTPATVLAAIAQAARKGVLIKGGAHLENMGVLRALAFDKTGTLTEGTPEVTELVASSDSHPAELLEIAATVEKASEHPLARAVVRRAMDEQMELRGIGHLESLAGRGIRADLRGHPVEIGALGLWNGTEIPGEIRESVQKLERLGRSTMTVRHGERWLGVIALADRPRPNVGGVLDQLRALGISNLIMLTGDNQVVGKIIGGEVGVDKVLAGLLPEDKLKAIRELLDQVGAVGMVGDGVNDAPALAEATVGIAMGGAGNAAVLESADVALMGNDLEALVFAIGLSRAAKRVIRQNLWISLGVIGLLVVATITGLSGIGPTVVAHEGSTLLVLANALRLLGYQHRPRQG